jgi:excisionase family DNA binding protein
MPHAEEFVNRSLPLVEYFFLCYNAVMKNAMLTTQEAAERLGVSRRRINDFIKDGRLPAQRHGRDYIIQEKDLDRVEERRPGRPRKSDK